ncbi:MAG: GTPase HflX [Candidatus Pacebacteria bacterium]|nr:GTPase HflX [Candidatus Paceibacterota bacterium]
MVVHRAAAKPSKAATQLPPRNPEASLAEAVSLAAAIALPIHHSEIIPLRRVSPATLLGKGSVERVKGLIAALEIGMVFVDYKLSPVQQRNLETEWNAKVIDRTGLILEIFGERARTHEGVLQVELAALSYQRSRLVRSWTHLERQRGGFGFMGGPGESQLEMDRRLIDERIVKLKKELEQVKRTRGLHRSARQLVPFPVVALAGYTNSGKSTLFNRLTGAEVRAENLLFATLDPTLRGMVLPSGRRIILSDTVGFISDLPTELIAAFRATLEEVAAADLILHIHDSSHPDRESQAAAVEGVLNDLLSAAEVRTRQLEVWNKSDLLAADSVGDGTIPISALTGAGIDGLLAAIDGAMADCAERLVLELPVSDGKTLAWLHQKGQVHDTKVSENSEQLLVEVTLEPRYLDQVSQFRGGG